MCLRLGMTAREGGKRTTGRQLQTETECEMSHMPNQTVKEKKIAAWQKLQQRANFDRNIKIALTPPRFLFIYNFTAFRLIFLLLFQ